MRGVSALHFGVLESTNKTLRELIDRGEELNNMFCVTASYQESGRGQYGNSWESERGKNLLASILYKPMPEIDVAQQFYVSMAVSEGVCLAIQLLTEGRVKAVVKWPNDIYVGDKKLCGILIENLLFGRNIRKSIIGVGLNVNQVEFRSDAPNPVSLSQICDGAEFSMTDVKEVVRGAISVTLMRLDSGQHERLREDYKSLLYWGDGELHPFSDSEGEFKAKIVDVLEDGHLVLEDEGGQTRWYLFKEVSFEIPAAR